MTTSSKNVITNPSPSPLPYGERIKVRGDEEKQSHSSSDRKKLASAKAVIFDVGYTLLYPAPSFAEVFCDICKSSGISISPSKVEKAEFKAWHQSMNPPVMFTLSTESSKKFWTRYYNILLEELGIKSGENIVEKLYEAFSNPERYNLYPDVLPALKVLQKKDKKMGIISNWEDWLENRLRDLDITGYFDFIVVSAMVGTEKPDPRIFEIGLGMAGLKPSETVYVGDNPDTDIHPALELGMKAVLLDRKGRFTNTRYRKVSDLNEFAGIFLTI